MRARDLGIQWGFNGRVDSAIGNTTGLAFPNTGSLGGRLGQQGPIGTDPRAQPLDRRDGQRPARGSACAGTGRAGRPGRRDRPGAPPIGLNIGSRTPPEIAVATLAGLLADRSGRPGGFAF